MAAFCWPFGGDLFMYRVCSWLKILLIQVEIRLNSSRFGSCIYGDRMIKIQVKFSGYFHGWIVLKLKWRNKLKVAACTVVEWLRINEKNASKLIDLYELNYGRLVCFLMDKFKKHNMSCILVCVWVEKCVKMIRMEHIMELNAWLKFEGNAAKLIYFKYFLCIHNNFMANFC